jgi:hypothetical protein
VAAVARVRWRSSAPADVDEELVVDEDGSSMLVVRTARDKSPVVGTFAGSASTEDLAALAGQQLDVDLDRPIAEPVIIIADALARVAREQPVAALTCYVAVVPGGGLAFQAVGSGVRPARVELDRDSVIIHLERDGREIAWHEHPSLETGFVSPEPVGLGGVGRPAEIPPGGYGTIALSDLGLVGPGEVSVEARGWLRDEQPGSAYEPFRLRTAAVPLPT